MPVKAYCDHPQCSWHKVMRWAKGTWRLPRGWTKSPDPPENGGGRPFTYCPRHSHRFEEAKSPEGRAF